MRSFKQLYLVSTMAYSSSDISIHYLVSHNLWSLVMLCKLPKNQTIYVLERIISSNLKNLTESVPVEFNMRSLKQYRVSQKKRPAFERQLLPEYISNDI